MFATPSYPPPPLVRHFLSGPPPHLRAPPPLLPGNDSGFGGLLQFLGRQPSKNVEVASPPSSSGQPEYPPVGPHRDWGGGYVG